MKKILINNDFHILEENGHILMFSPYSNKMLLVSEDMKNIFKKIKLGQTLSKNEKESFDKVQNRILAGFCNVDNFDINQKFEPTIVGLNISYDCELRCTYCCSDGGVRTPKFLDREVAYAAIDLVIANAKIRKVNPEFIFSGGGNPTFNWRLFADIFSYAKEGSITNDLQPIFNITTNGILSEKQADFICDNFTRIIVSFDGNQKFQNSNRPFPNGQGSYEQVYKTLKYIDARNKEFNIRATVTNEMLDYFDEFIENVSGNFKNVKSINLKPFENFGRAKSAHSLNTCKYIEKYKQIVCKAKKLGIAITPLSLSSRRANNCGAQNDNFLVYPGGVVSACTSVNPKDTTHQLFIYGKYNKSRKNFDFEFSKLKELRKRNINNLEECKQCYAKFFCAGGCALNALIKHGNLMKKDTSGCELIRGVVKAELFACFSI